jgi:isoleucyl-tRNA synthetase
VSALAQTELEATCMSDKQTPENAVDYKATLNLPGTEFAMKANLAVREQNG